MSWDAYLEPAERDDPDVGFEWNYTYNCNVMVATVLEEAGHDLGEPHWLIGHMGKSWLDRLSGCTGAEGGALLIVAIKGLEAEPDRFRKMNPSNGWGDYDSLLVVLREMRDRSRENPTWKWRVRG